MKKGKIAIITACAVVLILGGIIALSKVFETSWQKESTVNNSLDADITDAETSFDYPYITYEEAGKIAEKDFFITAMLRNYKNDYIPVPDGAITYQQAVNTVGEAVTYTTGLMGHQKNTSFIHCCERQIGHIYSKNDPVARHRLGYDYIYRDVQNGPVKTVYCYNNFNEQLFDENGSFVDTAVSALVDVFTGEIYELDINYNKNLLNENPKFSYSLPFGCNYADEQTAKDMLAAALETAELMGCKQEFGRYCVLEYEGYYSVYLESSFGNLKNVMFLKEANNCVLRRYSAYELGISPYNFTFREIE